MEEVLTKVKTGSEVDYESGYHDERHPNHANKDYYDARAKIALSKFFSGIDKSKRLLDYGCGLGQNIFFMPNAVGYDISKHGVSICREKGINATNNLDDLENESFDYVFSSHVLEHHPYPKQMIEEMRNKLKTGSDLLLVIPFERHGKAKFELDLNQHLYNWNFQNINNLLLTTGFNIKENKYLRGAGYNQLLKLSKKNFELYRLATNTVSYLAGIKEMMVVATKV